MTVHALLRDAIDYAGLFPPAQLDMAGAVAEYASYLDSDDAWALGRFVVPASRLEELATTVRSQLDDDRRVTLGGQRWSLSAVFGADVAADTRHVTAFNDAHDDNAAGWRARVDAVELRAATPPAIAEALRIVPASLERFVEIPIGNDPLPLVRTIKAAYAYAKVRTGGTTADAFPRSEDLARFLAVCVAERVPFKATAGLHHPLRGNYPLTYEPGSDSGRMYGFVNVLLGTALAFTSSSGIARLLEESDPAAFRFDDDGVTWKGQRLSASELRSARELAMRSFGSCSFREPIDDLTALGLL